MSEYVTYGVKGDGPVFSRACPQCGRYMKMPPNISWREGWTGHCEFFFQPPVTCKRCGPVKAVHLGWTGDFE